MTRAPKKLHLRRKSCALFFKERPFCLLGWGGRDRENNKSGDWPPDKPIREECSMRCRTLMTFCSTMPSNHSIKDSTVAFFLRRSFSSWNTAIESSMKYENTRRLCFLSHQLCVSNLYFFYYTLMQGIYYIHRVTNQQNIDNIFRQHFREKTSSHSEYRSESWSPLLDIVSKAWDPMLLRSTLSMSLTMEFTTFWSKRAGLAIWEQQTFIKCF